MKFKLYAKIYQKNNDNKFYLESTEYRDTSLPGAEKDMFEKYNKLCRIAKHKFNIEFNSFSCNIVLSLVDDNLYHYDTIEKFGDYYKGNKRYIGYI